MPVTERAPVARRRRTRRRVAHGLLVALAALALASPVSCGTDEAALDGTSWRLVRWSEAALDPADFTITAEFEDGRIGGTSAVNSYGGPYETGPGDRFSVGPLAATMMAGSGKAGRAEKLYFELLKGAETFSRSGDTLTLFDADGREALVFELVQPPE